MDTQIIRIDPVDIDKLSIKLAADIIKQGGLVAFPTETVYGLGADSFNVNAIKKIFIAKGRPSDNPLISHIYDISQLSELVLELPDFTGKLADKFWPGPLTLIFRRRPEVSDLLTGGLDTVAVRMPSHPVAYALLKAAAVPVAAPSANISGRPSPTCSRDVIDDLSGKVDVIIDSDNSEIGVESTVLDISSRTPVILRPGAVTAEQISDVIGREVIYNKRKDMKDEYVPRSPGMKYRHYSPKAKVVTVNGSIDKIAEHVYKTAKEFESEGKLVGILSTLQTNNLYKDFDNVICLGDREKLRSISASLFTSLRDMDKLGVDVIIAEGVPEEGLGIAIMNRLSKASEKVVDIEKKVLFVCTGNTCRSCMAEAIFNSLNDKIYKLPVKAFSRGIYASGGPAALNASEVLDELYNIDLSGHISRNIDENDIRQSFVILAMTKAHKDILTKEFAQYAEKIFTLSEYAYLNDTLSLKPPAADVLDPYGFNKKEYLECAMKINELVDKVLSGLKRGLFH